MGIFDRLKKGSTKAESTPAELGSGSDSPPLEAVTETAPPADSGISADEPESAEPTRQGLFSRFRQGLKKTTDILNTDVRDLFRKEGELLDEEFLDRLYAILIRTDMGAGPANEIRDEIQTQLSGRVLQMSDVLERIKAKLNELTLQTEQPIGFAETGPTVIVVVGVNGSGKTTSIAKLANRFRQEGKSVVLGAGDTFRAAAVEQLSIWAERIGVDIVKGKQGSDPASVAYQAVARAIETDADVCIVDTAGRLQTQVNLMEQLSKIRRVIAKQIPAAPHEVLLVLDATAGQNGISQARGFSEAVDCTGIVLAKLDGTAKGGVVIPIRQQFSLPVKFVGVGEQVADLAIFESDQFVEALFADLDEAA